MPRLAKHLSAHRERPEARAQGDKTLPILVGKFLYRPVESGRVQPNIYRIWRSLKVDCLSKSAIHPIIHSHLFHSHQEFQVHVSLE